MKNARRSFGSRRSSGRAARGGAGGLFRSLRGPVRSSPSFFPKRQKSARRSGLPARSRRLAQGEMLEKRLALATNVVFQTPSAGAENWMTVIADDGSDIYAQVASTAARSLLIADNASFTNRVERPNFEAQFDDLYVYHGQLVEKDVSFALTSPDTRYGVPDLPAATAPDGYPFVDWLTPEGTFQSLQFNLESFGITLNAPVSGRIELKDSQNTILFFDNNGGQLTNEWRVTSPANLAGPLRRSIAAVGGSQTVVVSDDRGIFPVDTGSSGVPELVINFQYQGGTVVRNSGTIYAAALNVPNRTEHVIFLPEAHQMVPGSLSGEIYVEHTGGVRFPFQVDTPAGSGIVPLSFTNARVRDYAYMTRPFARPGLPGLNDGAVTYFVQGELNMATGVATLTWRLEIPGTPPTVLPTPVSPVVENVRMGLVDLRIEDDPGFVALDPESALQTDIFGTRFDTQANDFTLYPGHVFTRGLVVELPNEYSNVTIESPLVTGRPVRISGQTVSVNAPLRSSTGFSVPSGSNTAFGTSTESITINAATSAPIFDLRMNDDPSTPSIRKGSLVVTQTGSLTNEANVLLPLGPNPALASALFAEVIGGDVFIEGQVRAVDQSWILSSPAVQPEGDSLIGDYPSVETYRLTTSSSLTGVDTGLIVADVLAIDLANDLLVYGDQDGYFTIDPDNGTRIRQPYHPTSAFAELDINTRVGRLRVQAADRAGDPQEQPFPYRLTVREEDDLIVDAVAGSSLPLSLTVGGTLDLIAKLESAGDIALQSQDPLVVGSPITTSFGLISLTAPEIDVLNSVRVLDNLQDERTVDIAMTATDGALRLQDAVSGINRVVLEQAGAGGGITGNARVSADIVDVRATGGVTIRTAASRVSVRTPLPVTVDELDYGIFEVRESGSVTLIANGFDQVVPAGVAGLEGLPEDRAVTAPALFADVYDTQTLTVSAPNGSIDVFHYGSTPLDIGDPSAIQSGASRVMQAAGSVTIRSSLSAIEVYDAPYATSSARNVRMATTGALRGSYVQYVQASPGVIASRINDVRITRVNAQGQEAGVGDPATSYPRAKELDGIDVTTLRVGDRILVKDGVANAPLDFDGVRQLDDAVANGIYQILSVQYLSDAAGPYVELDLVRASDADTTDDVAEKHYVRVAAGETQAGMVFSADGAEEVLDEGGNGTGSYSWSQWGRDFSDPTIKKYSFANVFDNDNLARQTPVSVRPVLSRTGFKVASAVTTVSLTLGQGDLAAEYDADNETITGTSGAYRLPEIDGVRLDVGDLVVVRYGAGNADQPSLIDPRSPGLYEVEALGDGNGLNWRLKRHEGVDDDGDGRIDSFFTGRVAIAAGNARTSVTGEMFEISLNSLGWAPLRYHPVERFTFGDYSLGMPDSVGNFVTNIGTDSPSALVDFVVSTELGTNNATGSLGRMMRLIQENSARNERTLEPQDSRFRFGNGVSRIVLTQALPPIERAFELGATLPVMIEGSRIVQDANGAPIRSGSIISNTGPFRANQSASSRRLIRSGTDAGRVTVNGLVVEASADSAVIRNLHLGGFLNGAAVSVLGAENVLVEGLTIGVDPNGTRSSGKIGIEVVGAALHTTLRNNTILNSTDVGIQLGAGTSDVHLVANTVGIQFAGNKVGIQVASQEGNPNWIGAAQPLGTSGTLLTGFVKALAPPPPVDVDEVDEDILQVFQSVEVNDPGFFESEDWGVFEVADNVQAREVRPGMYLFDAGAEIAREVVDARLVSTVGEGESGPAPTWWILLKDAGRTAADGRGGLLVGQAPTLQVGHVFASAGEDGIPRANGLLRRGDTRLVLPELISAGDVFIGQAVSTLQSIQSSPFTSGTVIVGITTNLDGQTVIEISRPIARSAEAVVTLSAGGRNQVRYNSDGIVLDSASSRIVNSLVSDQVYDGIQVRRAGAFDGGTGVWEGTHVIGGSRGQLPTTYSLPTKKGGEFEFVSSGLNVTINRNGLSGIRLMDQAFAALGLLSGSSESVDRASVEDFLETRLQIRGNLIGFDSASNTNVGNGLSGLENIVVDDSAVRPEPPAGESGDLERLRRYLFGAAGEETEEPDDGTAETLPGFLEPVEETGVDSQGNRYGEGDVITDNPGLVGPSPTPIRRPSIRVG